MVVETGFLYRFKDEFFEKVNDINLLPNHDCGHSRPNFLAIKDEEMLWFIPLSFKVEKYQRIIDLKIKKYGKCNTILIREIRGRRQAILIQNAFPIIEKYINHIHTVYGKPVEILNSIKDEILYNFKEVLKLKEKGINLFFTNIDYIKELMLSELVH